MDTEKERRFFERIDSETKIEIVVRQCALCASAVHWTVVEILKGKGYPPSEEESPANHFNPRCRKVCSLIGKLRELKDEAIKLGPDSLPPLLFRELGPAIEWLVKDVRAYLREYDTEDNVTYDFRDSFLAFKEQFRPESRKEEIVDKATFADVLNGLFATLEADGRAVARMIEVVEDRRAEKSKTQVRNRVPGKGRSGFEQLGVEYKGVKVKDGITLVLFGEQFEVTSRSCWRILDGWLSCHFADVPFRATRNELDKFKTGGCRGLTNYIHLETLEEVGRPRRGNARYTGMARFVKPGVC